MEGKTLSFTHSLCNNHTIFFTDDKDSKQTAEYEQGHTSIFGINSSVNVMSYMQIENDNLTSLNVAETITYESDSITSNINHIDATFVSGKKAKTTNSKPDGKKFQFTYNNGVMTVTNELFTTKNTQPIVDGQTCTYTFSQSLQWCYIDIRMTYTICLAINDGKLAIKSMNIKPESIITRKLDD